MGRIQQLITGADGRTRTVRVIKPNRDTGVYSINMLYPLEISLQEVETVVSADQSRAAAVSLTSRPTRRAAELCKQRLAISAAQ